LPGFSSFALTCKRFVDVCIATIMVLLLFPFMVGIASIVWIALGRPVIYGQTRPGKNGRLFRLWKFRTMTEERSTSGGLLPDGERLTALGHFLRRYSLDELPQLFNVLSGDLSLVGPRPLLVRYLPRYTERQHLRHLVKPGITGWAQVHGRNSSTWLARFEADIWYIEHWSLLLDFRIMIKTVFTLFNTGGVKSGAGAEFDEYWGPDGPPEHGPRAYPVESDEILVPDQVIDVERK
jgi:lipopolysaccharide/colanic/teichoic acid biosynthesis glycosyltransferase